jgi:hypothetical protein
MFFTAGNYLPGGKRQNKSYFEAFNDICCETGSINDDIKTVTRQVEKVLINSNELLLKT